MISTGNAKTWEEVVKILENSGEKVVHDKDSFYWHHGIVKIPSGHYIDAWMLLDHDGAGEHWDTLFKIFFPDGNCRWFAQSAFDSYDKDFIENLTKSIIPYQYQVDERFEGDIHTDKDGWSLPHPPQEPT